MSNELAILDTDKIMALWEDNKNLQEIKTLYAPKSTDLEFRAFVEMGKATGLNPFLREIWLVKYESSSPAQIFIGRDGYRKLLARTNGYQGHIVDAVYSNDEFHVDLLNSQVKHIPNLKDRGRLLGAYCIVYMKGLKIPAYTFAELSEYDLNRSVWKTHKATMIKKVAEAQTTRMASQVCSGTYSPDEMPEHLLRDQSSKSDELNQKYTKTFDSEAVSSETINEITGEVLDANQENNSPYEYEELKEEMEKADNMQSLNDLASFISQMTITKTERDELAKIYRKKISEIKKMEVTDGGDQ